VMFFYIHHVSEGLVLWYPSLVLCLSLNWINIYWIQNWWMPLILCIHNFGCFDVYFFLLTFQHHQTWLLWSLKRVKPSLLQVTKPLNANFLDL
jgi:hypothetical protein